MMVFGAFVLEAGLLGLLAAPHLVFPGTARGRVDVAPVRC